MGRARTQVNKPHKSRFASKSSRNEHKTDALAGKGRVSKPAVKGGRAARVQRSKAIRDQKRAALLKEKRTSFGSGSSPHVIVLFGLSSIADTSSLARDLLALASGEESEAPSSTVCSSAYKLRTTVLQAPHGDLLSCMEMLKVADLLAFVVSARSLYDNESSDLFDSFGTKCLSVFRSMGLPSTAVFIQDLPSDVKSRQDLKNGTVSSLSSELAEDCKFYAADTKDDLHKFMWLLREQKLASPHWRGQRPYVMCEEVQVKPDDANPAVCTLLLSGYLRAHNLSVNQLVHVSGVGDFQLSRMDILRDPCPLKVRKTHGQMDLDSEENGAQIIQSMEPDQSIQQPLLVENIPDPLAGEQTWPTEAEMMEADKTYRERKYVKRKLPQGTSEYQAAWIVDSDEDEDFDSTEQKDNGMVVDDVQDHELHEGDHTEADDMSYQDTIGGTDMEDDATLTNEQIEAEIKRIKEQNADDEEFPDEVDTPLDVPAKKRFAKYRGLKSFRTSSWDPKESLPLEYAKIFAFDNFARTQKHVMDKAMELDNGSSNDCGTVGTYVRLHVSNVSADVASKLCQPLAAPLVVTGLFQHESKMSVLHFSIKKHDSYDSPVKCKESFLFHVGFRQFSARPLFSSDDVNSNKHKMERFLHHGRFSVASVYAPICFPPLPLVVLKIRPGEQPAVVAVGSLRSVDPDRIILKKIVLTGYPQRVSKTKAIVRYMFHNPEDVRWFKPVEVWTKRGRRGRIQDTVGTHGAMKCFFNNPVQQHDTVCMSLFKRAYPKWPEQLYQTLDLHS